MGDIMKSIGGTGETVRVFGQSGGVVTYDEVLTHFQIKKRYQDKAQCQCPAHDDRQASLTVTKGRDSVLIHCHANCSTENVLLAAGTGIL